MWNGCGMDVEWMLNGCLMDLEGISMDVHGCLWILNDIQWMSMAKDGKQHVQGSWMFSG